MLLHLSELRLTSFLAHENVVLLTVEEERTSAQSFFAS